MLTPLVRRFPELRLAVDEGDLRWRESILLRGLLDLPVHPAGAPVDSTGALHGVESPDWANRLCCAP
ncbi:Cytochrome P450 [Nocardia ninae]